VDSFNTAYYAALAQAIPVLFVAALATRFFERSGRDQSPR